MENGISFLCYEEKLFWGLQTCQLNITKFLENGPINCLQFKDIEKQRFVAALEDVCIWCQMQPLQCMSKHWISCAVVPRCLWYACSTYVKCFQQNILLWFKGILIHVISVVVSFWRHIPFLFHDNKSKINYGRKKSVCWKCSTLFIHAKELGDVFRKVWTHRRRLHHPWPFDQRRASLCYRHVRHTRNSRWQCHNTFLQRLKLKS